MKMRHSIVPSFQTGNVVTLSGVGNSAPLYQYTYGDKDYAMDNEGYTYVLDPNNGWVLDQSVSQITSELEKASPGSMQNAFNASASLDQFLKLVSDAIPVIIQGKQQSDLMKVNLQRAQQGLAPLNAANYTPGFNFGLTGDTQKLVIGVVGVGFAVWGLSAMMGGNRRRARR